MSRVQEQEEEEHQRRESPHRSSLMDEMRVVAARAFWNARQGNKVPGFRLKREENDIEISGVAHLFLDRTML